MGNRKTLSRSAKAAKRTLKKVAARGNPQSRSTQETPIDEIEQERQSSRLARNNEIKKRNAATQQLPRTYKRRKVSSLARSSQREHLESDKKAQATLKAYDADASFFSPLRNQHGCVEIIPEGLVYNSDEPKPSNWLCSRCNASLRARKIQNKFCRSSGFRIAPVPEELAVLSRMEARLVGLGVSFTTCVNLYRDGQEFTRGNAINYWNDPGEVVRELPRPLKECGVVFLASKSDTSTKYFRVRPDVVRRALKWLIANNSLYKHVTNSEENLQALNDVNPQDVPTIGVTEDEVEELQGPQRPVNDTNPTSVPELDSPVQPDASQVAISPQSPSYEHHQQKAGRPSNDNAPDDQDIMENLTESFELEGSQQQKQSQLEQIIEAVGLDATGFKYPVGELRCRDEPIDECRTKHLMQNCFPVLFPDGHGGYNPLGENEIRGHESSLTEFLRRISVSEACSAAINTAGCNLGDNTEADLSCAAKGHGELSAAMQVLNSLKLFFRVIRGSGLYWANARDDLMSMIGNRVLPTRRPTFFLTLKLSAADTIWPGFPRPCNPSVTLDECRRLSYSERRRYLNKNPDISAHHFNRRFQAFFDLILFGTSKPLGEIVDYFWRVKFNVRIGNSYGAAEYAAAYVSKAEPDTLRFRRVISKVIKRFDPNLSYHSILNRVANATLSVREVGAPEAIYILLRDLPMHSKSRSIRKVKVLRHHLRYYRVEPQSVSDLADLADSHLNTIRLEHLERAYMNRPTDDTFNAMSLATVAEEHETVETLTRQQKLDMLKHSRDACSVTPLPPTDYVFIINPDSSDQPNQNTTPDNVNANVEWKARHEYTRDGKQDLQAFSNGTISNERNASSYRYPITDNDGNPAGETMAGSQWIPFALAMRQSRNWLKHAPENTQCNPLRMIINEEGGSGKSWLIKHIVKDMHNVFGEHFATRRTSKRMILLAHQGTVAFNIKGMTLCSVLSFSSFSKSVFSVPYPSLTETKAGPAKLKQMQQQYRDVYLFIIDEFSMISCGMLYRIDLRMREIWPSHADELDVYFTGDAAQFDPVVPNSLSTPLAKISNEVQRCGREIWNSIESVSDIELFNTRCIPSARWPKWVSKAKHIAYKNVDVDAANEKNMLATNQPIPRIAFQHSVQQKRLMPKLDIPDGTVQTLLNDAKTAHSDHDRVISREIKLCIGAPVTLTFNMAQSAGLCNGTNAQVPKDIYWGRKSSDLRVVRRGMLEIASSFVTTSEVEAIFWN
ncbi:hypothetical protein ON010_g12440 [Phytophthora cinnamomi]|nr:hypothetical protein ON010_g12440 [Phytophthora cinnamomi]